MITALKKPDEYDRLKFAMRLAEKILVAAGSGYWNYTPQSRQRIVDPARECVDEIIDEIQTISH